jgi:thiol-disulfide isomerase/thioredoxin
MSGCLVDGQEGENRCLVWQPAFSSVASPMKRGVSGRIVYREPPPQVPVSPQPLPAQNPAVRNRARQAGLLGQVVSGAEAARKSSGGATILHLRTGDTIPCTITGIDEKGVTFESKVTEATFAANDQIQAVELDSGAPSAQIDGPKIHRLLTLPRMQRDNPPTHLVRAVDSDYLRGRVVSMDGEQLQIELRLETRIIRRDRIVRIIWLHPETLDPDAKENVKDPEKNANRIQAVPSSAGSSRLTFVPDKLEAGVLTGRSEMLGACRAELEKTDQLIIGNAIEQFASTLAFQSWKLKPAIEPAIPPTGTDDSDGSEGQESAMVGKPAPDISLDLLDGTKFKLAEQREKVVILDFWASWCGPCLQTMPQVDAVAHEFADNGVILVAINIEESADKVKKALTRLKLSTTVALDKNGRVAERYGATAIPQTVIIDREGKVVRLFVGGSPRFDEQLRNALKSVLGIQNEEKAAEAETSETKN